MNSPAYFPASQPLLFINKPYTSNYPFRIHIIRPNCQLTRFVGELGMHARLTGGEIERKRYTLRIGWNHFCCNLISDADLRCCECQCFSAVVEINMLTGDAVRYRPVFGKGATAATRNYTLRLQAPQLPNSRYIPILGESYRDSMPVLLRANHAS